MKPLNMISFICTDIKNIHHHLIPDVEELTIFGKERILHKINTLIKWIVIQQYPSDYEIIITVHPNVKI